MSASRATNRLKVYQTFLWCLLLALCAPIFLWAQENTSTQKTTPTLKVPADWPGQGRATQPDDDVITVESNLANVLFTAVDRDRRYVTTLRREDLRVTEDNVPQEIFTFERQTDLSLSLAILIDVSGSQEKTLPAEKIAARKFIESVIRPTKDEAAVISFAGEAIIEQNLSGSKSSLARAIERVNFAVPPGYIGGGIIVQQGGTPPGGVPTVMGATALWDAVWATSEEVLSRAPERTRRAIILLTDGIDTSSQLKSGEAIERTVKADAAIYAIGIGDPDYDGVDDGKLRKVCEKTGGRAFFPRNDNDLRAVFAQIEAELRSQYLIAYSPTRKALDGSFRKVKIEVTNPELRKQKLRLTYRPGYFANPIRRRS